MKTIDYDYHIPEELIAQFPSEKRDDCRLMTLTKSTQSMEHRRFDELPQILRPGDRLILNDTKVLPARTFFRKDTGAQVEILFTSSTNRNSWKALAGPAKHARPGATLLLEKDPSIRIHIDSIHPDGTRDVSLVPNRPSAIDTIEELLRLYGEVPLPPYIKRAARDSDKNTYQTVFAGAPGAIASPTAGLHFTERLLGRLKAVGIGVTTLTLHVGIGTFRPVAVDDPRDHPMHEESYILSEEAVADIRRTKQNGGRIIAVGTTVVRTLEHCSIETGQPVASSGSTRLLILPGYAFKAVDGLITNFHVPQSTLLMLVCAFAGKDVTLEAYRAAIRDRYRFFSYGDAMLIL